MDNTKWLIGGLILGVILLMTSGIFAATSDLLSFQGRLTDNSGNPISGTYAIIFKIYNVAAGGSPLWQEPQDVAVNAGNYSAILGSITPFGLTFNTDYWLSVKVGADAEMTPRYRLTPAPAAFYANSAQDASTVGGQAPSDFATAAHDHNTIYYTKSQLSTSGNGGLVHWDNITGTPTLVAKIIAGDNVTISSTAGTGEVIINASGSGSNGDMLKGTYDTNLNNKVDIAEDTEKFGGQMPNAFSSATHNHNADYLGISATAFDSDKLNGLSSKEFALGTHTHDFRDIAGFLNPNQYSAYNDLITESAIGPGISQIAPGDHNHFAAVWSGKSDANALEVHNNGIGNGIAGYGNDGFGVLGSTNAGDAFAGVGGISNGSAPAVKGQNSGNGAGVYGASTGSHGVYGTTTDPSGYSAGVCGEATGSLNGVQGKALSGAGIWGESTNAVGVYGTSTNGYGVGGVGDSLYGVGVYGRSSDGSAVYGESTNGYGVIGTSSKNVGGGFQTSLGSVYAVEVYGLNSISKGLYVRGTTTTLGDVSVGGTLSKMAGNFLIDHPLDPENKVLRHSFVELPDMKNIYDGTIILDSNGQAVVEMPDYFEALNINFRYQLTCIGGYAPVFVKSEIKDRKFMVASANGAKDAGLKVSWQVTGVRNDAYAQKHPIVVEEAKGSGTASMYKKGEYLSPDSYDVKIASAKEAPTLGVGISGCNDLNGTNNH